jgi:hypothetical protein
MTYNHDAAEVQGVYCGRNGRQEIDTRANVIEGAGPPTSDVAHASISKVPNGITHANQILGHRSKLVSTVRHLPKAAVE